MKNITFLAIIISIFVGLVLIVGNYNNQMYRRGYAAWVKDTGNPNGLSFEEWNAMRYSYSRQSSSTYIHTRR